MKRLYALVMMQLKDKVDFSFAKDVKKLITKIVLSIVRFAAITALCYALVLVCQKVLGLFWPMEIPSVMVFVLTLFFVLSVISCTAGLVKTMYFADDNKVLVTLPMSENVVFVSKLLVYYIYELIRNFTLLVPIIIGFALNMASLNMVSLVVIPGMILPVLVYTAVPVLVGALLSIPTQYAVRFFKRIKFAGYALFALIAAAVIYGFVELIALIPENINIVELYPTVLKPAIQDFLREFEANFWIFAKVVYIIIGERVSWGGYSYTLNTFLLSLGLVGSVIVLSALVFFTTKFLFYNIMRKSFEFEKKRVDNKKKNPVHRRYSTFFFKELRLSLRSIDAVPIMIFLMNKVFSAIATSIRGDNLIYAFNFLIMVLPLLASNSLLASSFSKEGRAGYIKKTKPVNILWPLTSKLFLNIVGSLISIIITVNIFGAFNELDDASITLVFFGILFLQYGHMIWSATLDIMNPQNEQYATSGDVASNPNENISTIVAFVLALAFAVCAYFLPMEALNVTGSRLGGFFRLFIIGLVVFLAAGYMYVAKVKAFYYER